MRTCPYCNEDGNDADERFCISCGADMNSSDVVPPTPQAILNMFGSGTTILDEPTRLIPAKSVGHLILDDKIITTVDDSYRLVGRADLKTYTDKNPDLISRSHFTVYRKNFRYMIKDGVTAVQDRPSEHGTRLNGESLSEDAELKNGDKITVSDVELTFKM